MSRLCQNTSLLTFLRDDLKISDAELQVIFRHEEADSAPVPMLLWQYGLISLHQLDRLFDWMENLPYPS